MRMPAPRLLPPTIVAIVALLAVKSVELVRAAVPESAGAQAAAPPSGTAGVAHAAAALPAGAKAAAAPADLPSGLGPASSSGPGGSAEAEALPISPGERKVLLELRERRRELDARESAIGTREGVLAAAQKKLDQRLVELEALQKRLEQLEADRKERQSESWQGLVSLYEKMKPRDAAQIFDDLDAPVLLQIVDRMKEAKAASILAAMHADKARDVTAHLAEMRTRRDGMDAAK